ncbi:hypothetical protein F2Q70_00012097 [Brassica cretica]|uniref:Replication factor A C-terminal domain-containing protein n=1 Tax=Brassica cretica TaxID=69181 RepID=A0A8S9LW09_BRACR|nr:hypothetical protein F2Q70_00012097 [Brassica cretica]
MGDITERNYAGNSTKLLDIQLRDLSETIIECTLWEKHAEDLHSYVKNNKTGPVILLGSLMRTKRYNGWRVLIVWLRLRFLQWSHPPEIKKDVESFPLSCWKTIDQTASTMEESTCVTFASIVAFQKECRWWYVGCKGCCSTAQPYFNPVTEQIEANKYSCDTCEKDEITTILRYKVQVKVADHTGKLMDLEGRKFAWIIRVKGTEKNYKQPSFKVFKLSDKHEVIHKFQDNVTMEVTTHPDLAISSSTCSAMQVENTSSEANDNDLPSCSHMTPTTKRQRSHSIDDEGIQESSTKPKGTSKMAKQKVVYGLGLGSRTWVHYKKTAFNRENEIPQELMDLEGRKIVCVIRVKGTEKNFRQPNFNVVKLSDTPDVIHNFQDNMRMEVGTHSDFPLSSSTCSAMQVQTMLWVISFGLFKFKSESDYREVTVNGIGDSFLRSLVLTTPQTDHEAVECFKGRLAFLENISCADVARNIGCGGLR